MERQGAATFLSLLYQGRRRHIKSSPNPYPTPNAPYPFSPGCSRTGFHPVRMVDDSSSPTPPNPTHGVSRDCASPHCESPLGRRSARSAGGPLVLCRRSIIPLSSRARRHLHHSPPPSAIRRILSDLLLPHYLPRSLSLPAACGNLQTKLHLCVPFRKPAHLCRACF